LCTCSSCNAGAGYSLAKALNAAEIIDPRPYAVGSLKGVFEKFQHLKNCLPAMGYGKQQIDDLKATIDNIECDTVVIGTPIDIAQVFEIKHKYLVARYDLEVVPQHTEIWKKTLDSVFNIFENKHNDVDDDVSDEKKTN
jgi:predicted GTPase